MSRTEQLEALRDAARGHSEEEHVPATGRAAATTLERICNRAIAASLEKQAQAAEAKGANACAGFACLLCGVNCTCRQRNHPEEECARCHRSRAECMAGREQPQEPGAVGAPEPVPGLWVTMNPSGTRVFSCSFDSTRPDEGDWEQTTALAPALAMHAALVERTAEVARLRADEANWHFDRTALVAERTDNISNKARAEAAEAKAIALAAELAALKAQEPVGYAYSHHGQGGLNYFHWWTEEPRDELGAEWVKVPVYAAPVPQPEREADAAWTLHRAGHATWFSGENTPWTDHKRLLNGRDSVELEVRVRK